jgi:hypothetical protein
MTAPANLPAVLACSQQAWLVLPKHVFASNSTANVVPNAVHAEPSLE